MSLHYLSVNDSGDDMINQNKALIRRYFTEVLQKGNYDMIKDIFSPSFIFSGPSFKKPIHGMPEGVYEFVSAARVAFPDLYVSIENEIGEENQVAVVWRITGTHKQPFRGVAPSGKYISITGTDIFYITDGKIEGMWAFFDMKSALEQLFIDQKKTRPAPRRRSAVKKK